MHKRRDICIALTAALVTFSCGCKSDKELAEEKAKDEEREKTNKKIDAYLMAQQFVEGKLKSPGSAKYPMYDDSYVTDLGNKKYRVTAYVDAQNSFGALLRSDFTVVIEDLGNKNWHLSDIEMKAR